MTQDSILDFQSFSEIRDIQSSSISQTITLENDDNTDTVDFTSTTGKPYGHGLFITYPQIGDKNIDYAKTIFITIVQKLTQLNKKLKQCEGGCCIENHNTTSGKHIHIIVNFPKQDRFYLTQQIHNILTSCCKHGDYQVLKNYPAACKYIKKDGNFWFNYDIQEQEKSRKDHRKHQNQETIQKLVNNETEPYFDGSIAPQNIKSTIQGIQLLKNLKAPTWSLEEKKVWFIFGKTRTGKSSYARSAIGEGNYYLKASNNKWFDGYEGQNTIIMEDLPQYTDYMMYHMKMWLDTVHQRVEIKGGSIWLNAKNIVITSNHCLWDCLAKADNNGQIKINQEDYDAVEARITHIWEATNKFFDWRNLQSFTYKQIK